MIDSRKDGEVRPLIVLATLLRHWKALVGLPVLGAATGVLLASILPPEYRASATILPESGGGSGGPTGSVMSLAQNLGIGVVGTAASPALYVSILESRSLTDSVLLFRYLDPRSDAPRDSANLIEILEVDGETPEERLEAAREALDELSSASVDDATRLIRLTAVSRYPALAAAVTNRQVALLNRFNMESRRTQARERRGFVETRLANARVELQTAEDSLQRFLQGNRVWEGSSELRFHHDRIQRDVSIKQEIVLTLAREYEQARIEEVNDTPVLTVIDWAVPAEAPDGPSKFVFLVMFLMLGGAIGLSVIAIHEYRKAARSAAPTDYAALREAWEGMQTDLRKLVRSQS